MGLGRVRGIKGKQKQIYRTRFPTMTEDPYTALLAQNLKADAADCTKEAAKTKEELRAAALNQLVTRSSRRRISLGVLSERPQKHATK